MKKLARQTGFIYFLSAIAAIYGYMYVPSQIMVPGDLALTSNNILANEFLFRSGRVSFLLNGVLNLVVGFMLFRLFEKTDLAKARLMVGFVVVGVALTFISESFNFVSLEILKGNFLPSFEVKESQELAFLARRMYWGGLGMAGIFYGLWFLPFGQLVYKSGFIPRIFGVLLIVAFAGYLLESLNGLLLPQADKTVGLIATILYAPGELLIIFWLMIMGANDN